MSSMLSAPATMPATSAAHLRPGVGALVGRHAQVLVGQRRQAALLGQGDHRDQPGARHQIRVVEDRRRDGSSVR